MRIKYYRTKKTLSNLELERENCYEKDVGYKPTVQM